MSQPDAFHWFHGKSVAELYGRLGAANPSTCRLEVRVLKDDKMMLRVVPAGIDSTSLADGTQDINESHICPFDCPS